MKSIADIQKKTVLAVVVFCLVVIFGMIGVNRLYHTAVSERPDTPARDPSAALTGTTPGTIPLSSSATPPAPGSPSLGTSVAAVGNNSRSGTVADPAAKPLRVITLDNPWKSKSIVFSGGSLSAFPVEPVIEQRTNGYSIKLHVPGFTQEPQVQDGEVFAQLAIPGWSRLQEIGKPAVPLKTIMLAIPHGVQPKVSVTVLARVQVTPLNVWPAQPPFPDVFPEPPRAPFQRDQELYASTKLFPSNNLVGYSLGNIRNRRILTIEVTPVQVRAESRVVLIAEQMELNVTYMPDAPEGSGDADDGGDLPEGFPQGTPGKYMILMDDQFTNNATLAEFVEWKHRKGYDVTIVKTSDIDPGGSPINSQIISYMRDLPAGDYPEYLLIIGDHTAANGVEGTYFSTGDGGWTDLYIACRDATDYLPDLYHGRLPAVNNTYLTTMLNKVLLMDRNPPTNNIYQRVCIAGMIQDKDNTNNIADRLFCETADLAASYFEQDAGGVDYTCERALVNPTGVTSNGLWNPNSILWNAADQIGARVWQHFTNTTTAKNRISDNINSGIALIQHRDHGYSGGYGWVDPQFIYTKVQDLNNGDKLPVVFSINCCSGAYNQNRFLRAWFQNIHGGAYAVFAPVDVSFSWYNDWLTHGFYTAFLPDYIAFQNNCAAPAWSKHLPEPGGAYGAAGSAQRLGAILNFGKMYMREKYASNLTTFRLFHLFGDPEAFIQLLTPVTQNVVHAQTLDLETGTVTISNLEANAQVCLYSAELGVHQVTNSPGGSVTFAIAPATTGVVHVTVTRYGARPYENTITVDGAIIAFGAAQYEKNENSGSAWITVTRSGDTNLAVSMDYATSNGTAEAGADYTAATGTLAFAAGVISNGFSVALTDDGDPEGYQTVNLYLLNPSADAMAGRQSQATIRIEDNDSPGQIYLSSGTYSASETNATVIIPIERINGSVGTVSVAFAVTAGTAQAGMDFAATNGTLVFEPGVISNHFCIQLTGDYQDEPHETILIALSNPAGGCVLLDPTNAVLTIVDNDTGGTLTLSADAYAVSETNAELRAWVQRTGGSDGIVTVDFATSNGTAVAGSDYIATNGTLTLAHGVASNSFNVIITNLPDATTNETFSIRLSNLGGGAVLGAPSAATVTVWDASVYLHEDFERHGLPSGWTQEYVVASADWIYQTGGCIGGVNPATAYSGSNNACLFALSATDHKTRLITPPVDFGAYKQAQLTFWHFMKAWGEQDELRVYYKIAAGGDWNLLATYTTSVSSWLKRTISLPDLSADYYVAFEGNARRGYGVCLDDVQISGTSTNVWSDITPPSPPVSPVVLAQSGQSVVIGWGAATDNVAVVGYKVYRNGAQMGNVNGLSFTNTGLTPGVSYTNRISAYDAAGNPSALSSALVVMPWQAVAITLQPRSQTNAPGSAVEFRVAVSGTAPFGYQWRKDGVAVAGGLAPAYMIASVTPDHAGAYCCVVTNVGGGVTSRVAILSVITTNENPVSTAPGIVTQPQSATVDPGAAIGFSVTVTGTAPLAYQWQKNGVAILGAAAARYSIPAAAQRDEGNYRCVVQNMAGVITSAVARLTVNDPPALVEQPAVQRVRRGAAATFGVTATGLAPLTYQWRKDGVALTGATADRYTVAAAERSAAGYYDCVVNNKLGAVTSAPARLIIKACGGDVDGDGCADPWVMEEGVWYFWFSAQGYQRNGPYDLGVKGTPLLADFDGDSLADLAVVTGAGQWHLWCSAAGYGESGPYDLGMSGTPLAEDFDGDGMADPVVVLNGGQWYFWHSDADYSLDGPYELEMAGIPMLGDFDGDGCADPALVITDGRGWYVWGSDSGYQMSGPYALGVQGTARCGDFDGDGLADPVMIDADGYWHIWYSNNQYQHAGPYALP